MKKSIVWVFINSLLYVFFRTLNISLSCDMWHVTHDLCAHFSLIFFSFNISPFIHGAFCRLFTMCVFIGTYLWIWTFSQNHILRKEAEYLRYNKCPHKFASLSQYICDLINCFHEGNLVYDLIFMGWFQHMLH